MPKIISVPKNLKSELEAILKSISKSAVQGVGLAAGANIYNEVKNKLSGNNISYQEHNSSSSVPNDHVHWEHK